MLDDIEKRKAEVEKLSRLERLVDRYAQSRSLGLLIPLAIIVINTCLLIGSIELAMWKPEVRWTGYIVWLVAAWVVGSVWVTYKLVAKYEFIFYRKDGKIKLKTEKNPGLGVDRFRRTISRRDDSWCRKNCVPSLGLDIGISEHGPFRTLYPQ